MQRLDVSGAVRPLYGSLGVKWLIFILQVLKINSAIENHGNISLHKKSYKIYILTAMLPSSRI